YLTKKENINEYPKFIGLTTSRQICMALDEKGYYATDASYLFTIKKDMKLNYKFVLAILNSNTFQFLYNTAYQGGQRIIPQIKAVNLYNLPFPIKELKSFKPAIQNNIIRIVDSLFHLNKDLHAATLTTQREQIQRAIDHTERKIDELVYELYGLSEEEMRIVEGV
ncbi:TaqI-like C-terminal specificity domain-containing protein, partial [Bacteroidota bacterium]